MEQKLCLRCNMQSASRMTCAEIGQHVYCKLDFLP